MGWLSHISIWDQKWSNPRHRNATLQLHIENCEEVGVEESKVMRLRFWLASKMPCLQCSGLRSVGSQELSKFPRKTKRKPHERNMIPVLPSIVTEPTKLRFPFHSQPPRIRPGSTEHVHRDRSPFPLSHSLTRPVFITTCPDCTPLHTEIS